MTTNRGVDVGSDEDVDGGTFVTNTAAGGDNIRRSAASL